MCLLSFLNWIQINKIRSSKISNFSTEQKLILQKFDNLPMESGKRSYRPLFVFPIACTAALSPIFWGYILGEVSPTQEYMIKYIYNDISSTIMYLTVAIRNIGAMVGAFWGGSMCNLYGPRKSMMISDIIGSIAALLCAIPNVYFLLLGRFLGGIYTGLNCVFVPLYIGQYSPVEVKGITGPFTSTFDGTGVVIANLIGLKIAPNDSNPHNPWWWIVLLCGGIFPFIRYWLLKLVYTSDPPITLVQGGRIEEAQKVFHQIYLPDRAEQELKTTCEAIKQTQTTTNHAKLSYRDMFTPQYRMALFVGCFVISQVQTTGFQFVQSYATFIFKANATGPEDYGPRIYSILTALLGVISSVFTGPLVQRFGRRMMMLGGQTAMALWDLVFIVLTVLFPGSPLTIPVVMLAFVSYFVTLSPVKWIYLSDILPAPGLAIANLCNFTTAFIITQTAPLIMDKYGIQWSYFMFFLACIGGFCFAKFIVKETKGLSHFETLTLYCPHEVIEKELKEHAEIETKQAEDQKSTPLTERQVRKNTRIFEFLNNRMSFYGERVFIPQKLHVFINNERKRKSTMNKVPHSSNSIWISQAAKNRKSLQPALIPLLISEEEDEEMQTVPQKSKK